MNSCGLEVQPSDIRFRYVIGENHYIIQISFCLKGIFYKCHKRIPKRPDKELDEIEIDLKISSGKPRVKFNPTFKDA